ncbi:hypothetical protein EDD17DRAFT_1486267, partial [Pisolithus thermaeus]
SSCPKPIPAHEWTVVPPIFTLAIPVEAVIAKRPDPCPPQTRMISRSRTDLPVPERSDPVKNTFSPL